MKFSKNFLALIWFYIYKIYVYIYNEKFTAMQFSTFYCFASYRADNITLSRSWRHLRDFGHRSPIIFERAGTVPSHGVRCLSIVSDRVAEMVTENLITLIKLRKILDLAVQDCSKTKIENGLYSKWCIRLIQIIFPWEVW